MTDRAALIARITDASAPSRELNIAIWEARGLTEHEEDHCRMWCQTDGRTDLSRTDFLRAWAPSFSSSIDAALTLVKPGCEYQLSQTVSEDKPFCEMTIMDTAHPERPLIVESHPLAPLAIVLAALRMTEDGNG